MHAWGFRYITQLVWAKRRKDGGPDGRGVGFYFRNVTEPILFGVRGNDAHPDAGRRQVNMIETRKREHSRKPDEQYDLIESCSPGPYLELFARYPRHGWHAWGHEADPQAAPRGKVHAGYRRSRCMPCLRQVPATGLGRHTFVLRFVVRLWRGRGDLRQTKDPNRPLPS